MVTDPLSYASRVRRFYAHEIAEQCPPSLYSEIALTGSSATGLASDASDMEINFWTKKLPPVAERVAWLETIGVKGIHVHEQPRSDQSVWIEGVYKDVPLEVGWQTQTALRRSLKRLFNGETTDHKELRLADLILTAISLCGSGTLDKWQPQLAQYPYGLAKLLVSDVFSVWADKAWFTQRQTVQDGSAPEFEVDINRIWRVLFAINRRWEINWKYAPQRLSELERVPIGLLPRINALRQADSAQGALITAIALIRDVVMIAKVFEDEGQLIKRFDQYAREIQNAGSMK